MYLACLPKKKYWYHGTTVEKTQEIFKTGILEDKEFGLYFANRRDYAGNFARLADLHKARSHIVVFKIAMARIPNPEVGTDHLPLFFPKDLIVAVSHGAKIPVTLDDICAEWYYGKETA
jgi:hypothetical protein